jgi:Rrf2 family protein
MQVTRQADYATRAVLHLARAGKDQLIPTREVAIKQNIPSSFLSKIIAQLSIAGLLHTYRGAKGGIRLARQPQNITLLEVIEAIDGPIQLNVCVEGEGFCSFEDNCSIRSVWYEAQKNLITKLRSTNFAQLIA